MDLSFQQKSLWVMLVSLVVAFGFYFAKALPGAGVDVGPGQVALFVVAVVFLVVTSIVGHALIAIFDRRAETDERDRLIGLKGSRAASYVLAAGIFASLCAAVMTRGNFVFTHILLASWVLAQLVEYGAQLLLYRRGA